LSRDELIQIGLRKVGEDIQIDASVRFIQASRISLGAGVRIDAHCVLSAGNGFIDLSDKVHLSHFVRIYGAGGVTLGLASGVSSGSAIYSQTDDFISGHLAHPTIPTELRNIHLAHVKIGEFCIVGANSVLLPGAEMKRGSALGALSLLKREIPPYAVFAGSPARQVAHRDHSKLEELANKTEN
jgi:galactoside O-acetyltransferase